jgi:CysZ protein
MFGGIKYFFKGFKLIFSPGVKRFVIIPLIINMSIFALGFWLGMNWFDQFLSSILPSWLSWAEYILWPIFTLSYFLIVFYLFALLANIIAAPFNGLLAERVEDHLHNKKINPNDSSLKQLFKQVPRTVGSEINKLFYYLLRTLPLLMLFLIPGINIFAPVAWFLFSSWMLSLEYLDYPLGNHNMVFKQTRSLAKSQRAKCFSFGGLVSAFTMIPVVNFFIMPIAVAGATAFYVDSFANKHSTSV